ncbi:inositol 1, 3, 4-trisphosphate 5/6-kinase [Nitzschia inconspicua]|uniref:Inositol 1, 3, 4-trisphosphate 5/6-kinase n=1 Tax=Nitzschia inconspicua TaxID=303405 RepID=A0A9K3LVW4_9STRA|nr:inositol 1, 3, 4-trisphosphate 5/6-kinase [Nitzschia inconspicua]
MNCNGHLDSTVDEQLTFVEVGTDADSCNSSSMEGSSVFSRLSTKWREPIVVGYAFGPKKMRSMGVVMAEASRVKVIHEVPEEEEEEFEDGEEVDEKDTRTVVGGYSPGPSTCLNASRQCHERVPSTLTSDALQDLEHVESTTYSHQHNKTSSPLGSTVITLRNSNESSDLRHIVRCFRSNCSSAAESLASMSETSGSTTLISLNNNSSCSNRRPRKTRFPILISFVPLDLDQPLEDQHGGNFDLILHKLTEDILSCSLQQNSYEATADAGEIVDDQSRKRVEALQDYYKRNQHCCLVDNPRNVQTVMSRSDIADVLRRCLRNVTSTSGVPVRSPLFVVIPDCDDPKKRANDLKIALQEETQGLSTPLIVKPLIAAGTKESHCMLIALHETAFVKLPPKTIVQEYVNHDATLYKIYVLGDFVSVYERHSLPNLPDDLSTATVDLVEFDSQRPYPNLRDFVHNMDETDRSPKDTKFRNAVAVTVEEVTPVVRALKKAFGLELFGFDILRRSGDKEWLVVDVNYFPSYKEVPNFPSLLARYLTRRVLEQRRKGNDSG